MEIWALPAIFLIDSLWSFLKRNASYNTSAVTQLEIYTYLSYYFLYLSSQDIRMAVIWTVKASEKLEFWCEKSTAT